MAKRKFSVNPSNVMSATSVVSSEESKAQIAELITELDLMGFDVNSREGVLEGLNAGLGYNEEDQQILLERIAEVQGFDTSTRANQDWDWDDEDIESAQDVTNVVDDVNYSADMVNVSCTEAPQKSWAEMDWYEQIEFMNRYVDNYRGTSVFEDFAAYVGENVQDIIDCFTDAEHRGDLYIPEEIQIDSEYANPDIYSEDIYSAENIEQYEDEIQEIGQEFTSENTSINSGKLPAVFNMVQFNPGTVNIDYGGGKFDNVAEYLSQYDVINLVYDPYNRTKEHNQEVIRLVREHGGADTATCSNVLNVIKEEEVRLNVLNNIKKLVKPSGTVYITVYEGKGTNEGQPTKSGYQLNRKTADYLDEIKQVFPDATRKGKLIVCHPNGSVGASTQVTAETLPGPGDYNPPEGKEYSTYDNIQEIAELSLDTIINIDKEGNWTYEDESYDWARQDEKQADLYSDEYPQLMLSDHGGTVELVDSLLETRLPMEKGRYRISGDVTLVFDISGVEYDRTHHDIDDYEDEVYTDSAQATFNYSQSNITNFKCKKISKQVHSGDVIET